MVRTAELLDADEIASVDLSESEIEVLHDDGNHLWIGHACARVRDDVCDVVPHLRLSVGQLNGW